jgi:hypothetical protein
MLILVKRDDKVPEHGLQERRELLPGVFFEGSKGGTAGFLNALIVVKNHAEKLESEVYLICNGTRRTKVTYALHGRDEILVLVFL